MSPLRISAFALLVGLGSGCLMGQPIVDERSDEALEPGAAGKCAVVYGFGHYEDQAYIDQNAQRVKASLEARGWTVEYPAWAHSLDEVVGHAWSYGGPRCDLVVTISHGGHDGPLAFGIQAGLHWLWLGHVDVSSIGRRIDAGLTEGDTDMLYKNFLTPLARLLKPEAAFVFIGCNMGAEYEGDNTNAFGYPTYAHTVSDLTFRTAYGSLSYVDLGNSQRIVDTIVSGRIPRGWTRVGGAVFVSEADSGAYDDDAYDAYDAYDDDAAQ